MMFLGFAIVVCFCLFGSSFSLNFNFNEAKLIGAASISSYATAVKVLSTGDIILGGYSSAAIGGQTALGGTDFVIQKYAVDGTLTWTVQWGSAADDALLGMTIDANDNIYAIGYCSATVDSLTYTGNKDVCYVIYTKDGTKVTSAMNGGTGEDMGYGIAVDSTQTYLYTTGQSKSSNFNGLTRTGPVSSFWVKFKISTSSFQAATWVSNAASTVSFGFGCVIDSSSNIYVVGSTNATTYRSNSAIGGQDAIFAKYATSGISAFGKRVGSTADDQFLAVALDSSNNIFIVGYSNYPGNSETINSQSYSSTTAGASDILVMKYDSTGAVIWTKLYGGTLNDKGTAIAIDNTNSRVYITGVTTSTFYGASSSSSGSTFILVLSSSDGSYVSSSVLNSAASDAGSGIAYVSDQNTYVAGTTTGNYGSSTLTGTQDMYLLFLSAGSSSPTTEPTASPSFAPTFRPSALPTTIPSSLPTTIPSARPSSRPSSAPTKKETGTPSSQPTSRPSDKPSSIPTSHPSQPTSSPTTGPSTQPTSLPTRKPSSKPTSQPSSDPTSQPTKRPSSHPSASPTDRPSAEPSIKPTSTPTSTPSSYPSSKPSVKPSGRPSSQPTVRPTDIPTKVPSTHPTSHPSSQPTTRPTLRPTLLPTSNPTIKETGSPTSLPSSQPTSQPSRIDKTTNNAILGLEIGIPVGVGIPVLLCLFYYCCFIAVCFRKNTHKNKEPQYHDNKVHIEA